MHPELNVRLKLSIDENTTIPLAALAEFVTEQNIESVLLEEFVESLDASGVESLCGEKHAAVMATNAISELVPILALLPHRW
jgi:hypothetical protein